MTDQPVAAEPAPKVYPRRTRVPDWMTDVVLVVTAVFGVWAVVLTVLSFIGIAEPAFYYTDQKAVASLRSASLPSGSRAGWPT